MTRHGKKSVVLLPITQGERLKKLAPVDIKDWLLNQGPKFDDGLPLPDRKDAKARRRPIPLFKELNRGRNDNDIVSAKGRKAMSEQLEDAYLSAVANARLTDGTEPIKLRVEDL